MPRIPRTLEITDLSLEQARAVVAHLRGSQDFPQGIIDWLAVGRLGGGLAHTDVRRHEGTAPMLPLRAQTAAGIRRAIISGERPLNFDTPVSYETLATVYYILTAGQFRQECPNQTSPQGRHRWRFAEMDAAGVRMQVCDFCGDQRPLG
jgi:hypothetical protein